MKKMSDETWNVISAFQKHIKGDDSEVDNFSLSQIIKADEELAWRDKDSSYRLAMKNKIDELMRNKGNQESSHDQVRQWVIGILTALLVAGISAWLF